jgi:TrmH family RNA methyltransferase
MAIPDFEIITSRRNPRVQRIRKLLSTSQFRHSVHAFVLEGVRLVDEAIHSGWQITELYVSDRVNSRGKTLCNDPSLRDTSRFMVSESVLAEITETETPQGIVAVVVQRELPLPLELKLILILDAIRDPGNVGTILRTASAAGVDAVFIAPDTAAPFSPKVLRAGMGAQLQLPLREMDWSGISRLIKEQSQMKVLLADTHDGGFYWDMDLRPPMAFIISNEATGPSRSARNMADGILTIPMPGNGESLNVAIAASLITYEALRQRK